MFSGALASIVDQAIFPEKIESVAMALRNQMHININYEGQGKPIVGIPSELESFDSIGRLKVGQSFYCTVGHHMKGRTGHALGVAVEKIDLERYSIGVLNSRGWLVDESVKKFLLGGKEVAAYSVASLVRCEGMFCRGLIDKRFLLG